ncbi:MAG: class I SAM-dependent methyltransferase [Planctomycetota bacterium]
MDRPVPPQLNERLAARIEAGLRSSSCEELAELLWKLRRRWPVDAPRAELIQQARELELIEQRPDGDLSLTPLGARFSDSLTEYVYWKQRGKRHHASQEVGALRVERLSGKRILEVGCGSGVNLLSLQGCADVVGVDVEPLYLQAAAIFAGLEGLAMPRLVCALAEKLPFRDASFDLVLFPGSLPYMRIENALREAARVLRSGGRAIVVQSDLAQMFGLRARQRGWRLLAPGTLLRESRAFLGMVVYPWAGRALLKSFDPVHVTRQRTCRWLSSAGLRVNEQETCSVSHEVCYVADKLGRN